MSTNHPPSPSASVSEDEYIRLKLELAQARAATDTSRLKARQLISKRDGLREDTAKNRAESEEQQVCRVKKSIELLVNHISKHT